MTRCKTAFAYGLVVVLIAFAAIASLVTLVGA